MQDTLLLMTCFLSPRNVLVLQKSPQKAKFIGWAADKYIAGVDGQDTCTNIVFVATDGML